MSGSNIWVRTLVVILLLSASPATAQHTDRADEKQIIVVLRFDDYSSRSATDMEVKLINAFQQHGISCTFGVIPYTCARDHDNSRPQDVVPLTPTKASILRNAIKAGILDVAQHGYTHQRGEFCGLDYTSQVKRMSKGKNLLEQMLGTQVSTFIPPFNSYDLNTIRALETLGFRCISAGRNGDAKESSALKFLPANCGLPQLRDSVESARSVPEAQPIIVVLFHLYDFLEVDKKRGRLTYQEFIELLSWLTSQEDVYTGSIEQATKMVRDLSSQRFTTNRHIYGLSLLLPPFLSRLCTPPVRVYLSSNGAFRMRFKLGVFVLAFYLALLLLSSGTTFWAGLVVFPKSGLVTSISKYGVPALFVSLSIYGLFEPGYLSAMVIAILLGVCIGEWSSLLRLRRQGRLR